MARCSSYFYLFFNPPPRPPRETSKIRYWVSQNAVSLFPPPPPRPSFVFSRLAARSILPRAANCSGERDVMLGGGGAGREGLGEKCITPSGGDNTSAALISSARYSFSKFDFFAPFSPFDGRAPGALSRASALVPPCPARALVWPAHTRRRRGTFFARRRRRSFLVFRRGGACRTPVERRGRCVEIFSK